MKNATCAPVVRWLSVLLTSIVVACTSEPPTGATGCADGYARCGTVCTDQVSDANNCGACGVICAAGTTCVGGVCTVASPSCQVPYAPCGAACVDLTTDRAHCGACGNVCPPGLSCTAGSCLCSAGLTDCGGSCVDVLSSGSHCGACNLVCPAGTFCGAGTCGTACPAGTAQCGNSCPNLASDPANCGACGVVCSTGTCTGGVCSCPPGQAQCGGVCVSLASDAANCGACGVACAAGAACVNGACQGGVVIGTGGVGTGGVGVGGAVTGGVGASGAATGGVGTGGAAIGGAVTGGATTGGAATGGVGTGGAVTGGAGGSGGTATGGTTEGGAGPVTGYHVNGDWHGYAWSAVDEAEQATATEDPVFADMVDDGPWCISGLVPMTADYSAIAMVGFNVNQEQGEDPPKSTWTPPADSAGLVVNVNNRGAAGTTIRVQIQGPNGASSEDDRWCATLSTFNEDVTIPWDGFNTKCWDNSGDNYAGQPIESALVFVPGEGSEDTGAQDVPYDFCVNDIGPGGSGGGTGGGSTGPCSNSVTGSGTITDRYGRSYLKDGSRNAYVVQNNGWGNFQSQTLTYSGASFTISNAAGTPGSARNEPFSFPSIYIGTNGSAATEGSNLPRQVSAISSIPTCMAWSGGTGQFNVTYDVWFSGSAGGTTADAAYLMVWYHKPSGYQPVGTSVASAVSIAGQTWAVWYGNNGQSPVISYVHNGDLPSYSFDLKTFIDDAAGRGYLQSSWYLIAVMGGFEIWEDGSGHRLEGFSAVVN